MRAIPIPTIERLSTLYTILEKLENEGKEVISSTGLAELMGTSSFTIRKDINYLDQTGNESGYDIAKLKKALYSLFDLCKERRACIVGLGKLGCAIMNFSQYMNGNFRIVAGFDSNINIIETIETNLSVFPAYDIPKIVKNMGIEIGVIAVPPENAQITADRLVMGGVKGIMNFAPVVIKTEDKNITIKNFHIMEEFRILSIMMDQKEKENKNGQDI